MTEDRFSGRSKKTGTNFFFNMLNLFVTFVLSFFSRTVFIRGLGVGYLGLNGIFSDVLNLLSLADLGISIAMVQSFYRPLAEEDHEHLAALVAFYQKVYRIIALIVTLLGLMLVPVLPKVIRLDQEIPFLTAYYLLSLLSVAVSYLWVFRTSILTADQKGFVVTRINIVVNTVRTVLQVISVLFFRSYLLYLVLQAAGNITANLIASRAAVKRYPYIAAPGAVLPRSEQIDIFSKLRSVSIYKFSSIALTATDNLLISVLVGTAAVGFYSNYYLIESKITVFYSLIFLSVTASIGNLIVKEGPRKRREIFMIEQTALNILACITVPCYISLVDKFVLLWLGEEFLLPASVVYAIGLNLYLTCVLQPIWSFRDAAGLYEKTKWVMLVCAVMNLFLSLIMGRFWGVAGIILATSISRISTYIMVEPRILFSTCFDISSKRFYLELIANMAAALGLSALSVWVGRLFTSRDIAGWILQALVIGGICMAAALLLYGRTEGMRMLLARIPKRTGRKHE